MNLRPFVGAGLLWLAVSAATANPPAWWAERGAYRTGAAVEDYQQVNQGQLKNLATAAFDEMEARLPGGAGPDVSALVKGWFQLQADGSFTHDATTGARVPVAGQNYAPLNLGQLKAAALPFHQRLIEIGYESQLPWAGATQPAADYAIANLGQVKNLFAFSLAFGFSPASDFADSDGDGLPDWQEYVLGTNKNSGDSDGDGLLDSWEVLHGLDPMVNDASADTDSDGLSNLAEQQNNTDPNNPDSDGDGYTDGWEIAHGGHPTIIAGYFDLKLPAVRAGHSLKAVVGSASKALPVGLVDRVDGSYAAAFVEFIDGVSGAAMVLDESAGETLVVGDTWSGDYAQAGSWTHSTLGVGARQFFLLPASRGEDTFALFSMREGGGELYPLAVQGFSGEIWDGGEAPLSGSDIRSGSASATSGQAFLLIDLTTGKKAPLNATNLLRTDWTWNDLALPAGEVLLLLPDADENLHYGVSAGTSASIFPAHREDIGGISRVVRRFSLPPGQDFVVQRLIDGAFVARRYEAPGAATFDLAQEFPAVPQPPEVVKVYGEHHIVRATNGIRDVEATKLQAGVDHIWDENGVPQEVPYQSYEIELNRMGDYLYVYDGETYQPVNTQGATARPAPHGLIAVNLLSDREGHRFSVFDSSNWDLIWGLNIPAAPVTTYQKLIEAFPGTSDQRSLIKTIRYVEATAALDPTAEVWILDVTAQDVKSAHLTSSFWDLSEWEYTAPVYPLISATRWNHALEIHTSLGNAYPLNYAQLQGYWSPEGAQGHADFVPYWYFSSEASVNPGVDWWVYDVTTQEAAPVNQSDLITWASPYANVDWNQDGRPDWYENIVDPPVDSDGNGLPDAWELQYFGYVGVNGGASAPGGSGWTNAQALAGGIDPNAGPEVAPGADADGDGTKNGQDEYPTDPRRSREIPVVHYAAIDLSAGLTPNAALWKVDLDDTGAAFAFHEEDGPVYSYRVVNGVRTTLAVMPSTYTEGASSNNLEPQAFTSNGTVVGTYSQRPSPPAGFFSFKNTPSFYPKGMPPCTIQIAGNGNGTPYVYAVFGDIDPHGVDTVLIYEGSINNLSDSIYSLDPDTNYRHNYPTVMSPNGTLVYVTFLPSHGTEGKSVMPGTMYPLDVNDGGTTIGVSDITSTLELPGNRTLSLSGGGDLRTAIGAPFSRQLDFSQPTLAMVNNASEFVASGKDLRGAAGTWEPGTYAFLGGQLTRVEFPEGWDVTPSRLNNSGHMIAMGRKLVPDPNEDPATSGRLWPLLLMPFELLSDLNNNGKIDGADSSLKTASLKSTATDEEKEKGTEYLFVDDKLSNGLWDKDDPFLPEDDAGFPETEDDDDVQELKTVCAATWGAIWFEHPLINKLAFYTNKSCDPEDKLTFPFALSETNNLPEKLYVRAEKVTAQVEGDLVMKVGKADKTETWAEDKLKFTVVRELGNTKYFIAVRDYILENNTELFLHRKGYPADDPETEFWICAMREEATTMEAIETFHHVVAGQLRGIGAVVSSRPDYSVIVNGNQCFFSDGWTPWQTLGYPDPLHWMSDRCHGRLVFGGVANQTVGVLSPASSDKTDRATVPRGSDLAGLDANYISQGNGRPFTLGLGQVPDAPYPWMGLGGLSTDYAKPNRKKLPHTMVGYAPGLTEGKGIVFTASQPPGLSGQIGLPSGGFAEQFASDANRSGVPAMPTAPAGRYKLLILDSGGSSVGLAHKSPSGYLNVEISGRKHWLGHPYYVNTYLGFKSMRPRAAQ